MDRARDAFRAMNLNTVEYPVYWNAIEPEEASSTSPVSTRFSAGVRSQGLRAVLLWFAPGEWRHGLEPQLGQVRSQPLPQGAGPRRKPIRVLSPHSRATLEADKKAYTTMMKHLREMDETDRTVIMMQWRTNRDCWAVPATTRRKPTSCSAARFPRSW